MQDLKWIKKYLKLAKTLGDDNDSCYSRKIGSVLVSQDNLILGLGFNGPSRKTPHTDTAEYLRHLWTLLEQNDIKKLKEMSIENVDKFIEKYEGCKICPRKILEIPSGQRLDLCGCVHSEHNAILSASVNGVSTKNSVLYAACCVPCITCSMAIVQARISKVVCYDNFDKPLYSPGSPWLLEKAGVQVVKIDPSLI